MSLAYAIAMVGLWIYGLNLLWLAGREAWDDRLRRSVAPDPTDAPLPDGSWPLVTVQIPLYNEPRVAERVVDACARLHYPRHRLEIQVLDDSTDATTERVAARVRHWQQQGLDVVHVRRSHRDGYKAGALQNGLRLAAGDIIAVFDADFVPPTDFLQRLVPRFDDLDVGMVQARWGHLNGEASLLTRLQAAGLDAHFAVEQAARGRIGCFINFNGTAGMWRRACIEEAGGWQGDTLTEDLDLSYRAQLCGWRFRYVPEVEAPAELPASMGALRDQQARWAQGAIETARKLLGRLWRSAVPLRVRVEGTIHLTAHLAFPCILVAALLHAPLVRSEALGRGPGSTYFAVMTLGLVGFAGFVLAQVLAQRAFYPDWPRRLRLLPLFVAGSMGLAVSNTRAVVRALAGRRASFNRTPKMGTQGPGPRTDRPRAAAWVDAAVALYSGAGLVALVAAGAWVAVPFQLLFTAGFGMVAVGALAPRLR